MTTPRRPDPVRMTNRRVSAETEDLYHALTDEHIRVREISRVWAEVVLPDCRVIKRRWPAVRLLLRDLRSIRGETTSS